VKKIGKSKEKFSYVFVAFLRVDRELKYHRNSWGNTRILGIVQGRGTGKEKCTVACTYELDTEQVDTSIT
jgi:hypothetical protein